MYLWRLGWQIGYPLDVLDGRSRIPLRRRSPWSHALSRGWRLFLFLLDRYAHLGHPFVLEQADGLLSLLFFGLLIGHRHRRCLSLHNWLLFAFRGRHILCRDHGLLACLASPFTRHRSVRVLFQRRDTVVLAKGFDEGILES